MRCAILLLLELPHILFVGLRRSVRRLCAHVGVRRLLLLPLLLLPLLLLLPPLLLLLARWGGSACRVVRLAFACVNAQLVCAELLYKQSRGGRAS